jgi:hypothetical protein
MARPSFRARSWGYGLCGFEGGLGGLLVWLAALLALLLLLAHAPELGQAYARAIA